MIGFDREGWSWPASRDRSGLVKQEQTKLTGEPQFALAA